MSGILGWFNPTRWIALAVLVAGLVAGYFAWADHIGNVREAKVMAEYRAQADKVDAKREAIAAPIAAKQEAAQVQIRTITKTLIQKVPVYVKATDCGPLPGRVRVFLDAAADGQVPDPARVADAPATSIEEIAATAAENDGTYHEVAARLTGLQEWIRAQQEIKP
jgi:hypothetical protein